MLSQLLINTAKRHPARQALVYDNTSWTWDALLTQVGRLSAGLGKLGICEGDEVGIWANNCPFYLISYFAVLMRGATVVPCNPAWKSGDCPDQVRRLQWFLTTTALEQACRSATQDSSTTLTTSYLVCHDPDQCRLSALFDEEPDHSISGTSSTPALLQFSSGTTGLPKALYRTHAQCVAEVEHFRQTCSMTNKDVIFGALPLFHAHGMANSMWAAVGCGAKFVLMKEPQPFALKWQYALQLLSEHQVTVFPTVPVMLKVLSQAPEVVTDLHHIRLCFSAGAPLRREVFEQFFHRFGIPVRQLYGCTEAGSLSINMESQQTFNPDSVGRPMHGVRIEIRDGSGAVVSDGRVGEIVFYSKATTHAYEDGQSGESFNNGWFHTGDLGMIDDTGLLYIRGRKAFISTVAGEKVNLTEVEEVLQRHPEIKEVVILSQPDTRLGERLEAFIVCNTNLSTDAIRAFSQAMLPKYKQPQVFHLVDHLPKTPLGKIDRNKIVLNEPGPTTFQ